MKTLHSSRLRLRAVQKGDAEFILALLNDPDWLKYIGDRDVRNIASAHRYIQEGPQKMYAQHNTGLMLVESAEATESLGLCGLLKRSELTSPDLGFAFLSHHRRQGYAYEASRLVLENAFDEKKMSKVLAVTALNNDYSMALLKKLGFSEQGLISFDGENELNTLFELNKPEL